EPLEGQLKTLAPLYVETLKKRDELQEKLTKAEKKDAETETKLTKAEEEVSSLREQLMSLTQNVTQLEKQVPTRGELVVSQPVFIKMSETIFKNIQPAFIFPEGTRDTIEKFITKYYSQEKPINEDTILRFFSQSGIRVDPKIDLEKADANTKSL